MQALPVEAYSRMPLPWQPSVLSDVPEGMHGEALLQAMTARGCCPESCELVIARRPCEFGCYECDESLRYDVDAFQHRKACRFLSWGF